MPCRQQDLNKHLHQKEIIVRRADQPAARGETRRGRFAWLPSFAGRCRIPHGDNLGAEHNFALKLSGVHPTRGSERPRTAPARILLRPCGYAGCKHLAVTIRRKIVEWWPHLTTTTFRWRAGFRSRCWVASGRPRLLIAVAFYLAGYRSGPPDLSPRSAADLYQLYRSAVTQPLL